MNECDEGVPNNPSLYTLGFQSVGGHLVFYILSQMSLNRNILVETIQNGLTVLQALQPGRNYGRRTLTAVYKVESRYLAIKLRFVYVFERKKPTFTTRPSALGDLTKANIYKPTPACINDIHNSVILDEISNPEVEWM